MSFCCLAVLKRDKQATLMGQSAKRSVKFCRCCCANKVVGTRMATCLPVLATTKAARMATSVLPKPTSPQTTRSIGCWLLKSSNTSLIALSWSGVSSNGKLLQKLAYSFSSMGYERPCTAARRAWISSNSAATSRACLAAFLRALDH